MRYPPRVFLWLRKTRSCCGRSIIKQIESHLGEAVRLASACGLSREELAQMLELIAEEWDL